MKIFSEILIEYRTELKLFLRNCLEGATSVYVVGNKSLGLELRNTSQFYLKKLESGI